MHGGRPSASQGKTGHSVLGGSGDVHLPGADDGQVRQCLAGVPM